MTRLHIDVCNQTFQAIAGLARLNGIDYTEALCWLVRYSELLTTMEQLAAQYDEKEFLITVYEGDGRVVITRRRDPNRRWWHFTRPRYITERVHYPRSAHHDDNRLIVETPGAPVDSDMP